MTPHRPCPARRTTDTRRPHIPLRSLGPCCHIPRHLGLMAVAQEEADAKAEGCCLTGHLPGHRDSPPREHAPRSRAAGRATLPRPVAIAAAATVVPASMFTVTIVAIIIARAGTRLDPSRGRAASQFLHQLLRGC